MVFCRCQKYPTKPFRDGMEFATNCLACIYTVAIMSCHILYNKNKFYRKCSYRKIQRGEFDTVAKCGEFAVIEFAVIEKTYLSA